MAILNFDAYWRDHGVAAGMKGLGKNAKESETHVGALSKAGPKLAGAFAGFAAAEIFKSFVDGARESNMISRVTEQRIRQTGGAAHVTADQVGELATAISDKTGADDEAVQSGANMLLTFTGIRNELGKGNDVFNQATQAATDLAAGLNQGQVTAEGTQQAAVLLGKALNDPIAGMTALRRVGISFTASQLAQVKALQQSGHTLEAQKVILGEVNREFGGTAKAAADPLQRMSVILGNVGEDIGNKLLPALDQGANLLEAIPEPAYMAGAAITTIAVGAIGLGKAIEGVKSVHEATSAIYSIFAKRVAAAAAAEAGEAVAADGAAASTTAAGDAAAVAGTKFGALAGKLGLAGAVVGLAAVSTEATSWLGKAEVTKTSTSGLADAFLHLNDSAKAPKAAIDAVSSGMDEWYGKVNSSQDVMRQFGDLATGAFSMSWDNIIGRAQSGTERVDRFNATAGQMDAALAQLVRSGHGVQAAQMFDQLMQATGLTGDELQHVKNRFLQYQAAEQQAGDTAASVTRAIGDQNSVLLGVQHGGNVASTALHAVAIAGDAVTASARRQHVAQVMTIADAQKLSDRTLTLRQADRDLAQAKDDLTASLKSNGAGMSNNTSKGRQNAAALDQVATATLKSLQAHRDSGEPLRQYAQRVNAVRNALISEAEKAGMSRTAARKYADAILAVPRSQTTKYSTPGLAAARAGARGLASDISHINGRTVTVRYQADGKVLIQARGTTAIARARGGAVSGPGGPTADMVPALLSDGEFVVNAAATNRHRPLLEAINAQRLAGGGPVRGVASRYAGSFAPNNVISSFIDAWAAGWASSAGSGGGIMPGSATAGGNAANKAVGRRMAANLYGWVGGQWNALDALWMRESGWNNLARNPSSGAFGIPQGLPPSKMGAAAAGGNAWAQILWGLGYIHSRYGTPAGAWAHEVSAGWYDRGGYARGRGLIAKGPAPERVLSPRQTVAFERLVPLLSRSGGGQSVVHMHVSVDGSGSLLGIEDRVVDAFTAAARRGRLRRAVREAAGI